MKNMPWKAAAKIELSEKQESILEQMSAGTHTAQHLKIRAQIILEASKGKSNNKIRKQMEIMPKTVQRWRDRFNNNSEELKRIESETPQKTRAAIKKILSDEQRSGAPPKFKDEQVAAIIALSLEEPAKFDLPFSHWTPELLQNEAIKLGIVESISVRQIERFLKRKRFKAE